MPPEAAPLSAATDSAPGGVSTVEAGGASGVGPATAEESRRVFRSIQAFASLSDEDIEALVPLLRVHDYQAGATLFYEDDEPSAVYFLASGAVEVFKSNQSGKKMPLVVLRDAGLLGEIGLLIGATRTATARALNACRVLELQKEPFEQALADGNLAAFRLSLAFARVLASRLVTTDQKLFELFQNDVSDLLYKQLSELQARLLTRWTS
jgi:CRP-like cAMP-binding protein